MISISLCVLATLVAFVAARRSLLAGVLTVLAVGYLYGITRANLSDTFSHFIFDAAVVGLYLGQFRIFVARIKTVGGRQLRIWVGVLILWPVLLFLLPVQDFLIQLVGLRGNIFLLPFLLIGALLSWEELYGLAVGVAILSVLAFAVAGAEYFLGVEPFFPRSPVTAIIYASKDVANFTAFRIPSIFSSAHAYAGTMVMTMPLLLGAWVQNRRRTLCRIVLFSGLTVSILGVFLSATRSHFIVLAVVMVLSLFTSGLKLTRRLVWLVALCGIGLLVFTQERLQRFEQLSDTELVTQRFASSVNTGLAELFGRYPLGNGLGGGGTSIPYFLQYLIKDPVRIENEYGRILLEQGIPGLCLWICFIAWALTRKNADANNKWSFGRQLGWFTCAAYFATGLIGTGLLTSIPQTCLLLLTTGWIASPKPAEDRGPVTVPLQSEPLLEWQHAAHPV